MSIGVDVVELARVTRLLERYGDRFRRTIASPAEVGWATGTVRLAALFAVKEATVKAVDGRPARFRWTHVGVAPFDADHPILDAFAAGVGAAEFAGVRVEWPGECSAIGRWGAADGHVFAAVVRV